MGPFHTHVFDRSTTAAKLKNGFECTVSSIMCGTRRIVRSPLKSYKWLSWERLDLRCGAHWSHLLDQNLMSQQILIQTKRSCGSLTPRTPSTALRDSLLTSRPIQPSGTPSVSFFTSYFACRHHVKRCSYNRRICELITAIQVCSLPVRV